MKNLILRKLNHPLFLTNLFNLLLNLLGAERIYSDCATGNPLQSLIDLFKNDKFLVV